MRNIFKFYLSKEHTTWEWFCIKYLLIRFWHQAIFPQIDHFESVPIPTGICTIFPCDFLTQSSYSFLFTFLVIVFSILYFFEKKMLLSTFMISFLSLLFFTLEESNGVFERRGLVTFLFLGQFIAYLLFYIQKSDFNIKKYRIQFAVQVIAIGYFLSGLSKLYNSGISWVTDGVRMPLQILKSFYNNYADFGKTAYLQQGTEIAHFIETHHLLVYITLTMTLLLELGAISVLFFSRRYMIIYGLLLYVMHQGIFMVMNIRIVSIMEPMTILFLNSFYFYSIVLYVLFQKYYLKRDDAEIVNFR